MKQIEVEASVYYKLEAAARAKGMTIPEFVASLVKVKRDAS